LPSSMSKASTSSPSRGNRSFSTRSHRSISLREQQDRPGVLNLREGGGSNRIPRSKSHFPPEDDREVRNGKQRAPPPTPALTCTSECCQRETGVGMTGEQAPAGGSGS